MQCTASAWVDWLVVERVWIGAFVRSAERGGEIFARAAAGIDESAFEELLPRRAIDVLALALRVGRERSADVWAFVPADSKLMQIFDCGFCVEVAAAVGIEVFHAHHQGAVRCAGSLGGGEEGARVAYVQVAGGRRGEAASVAGLFRASKLFHVEQL